MTCIKCDSSCLTCHGITRYCTSCKEGSYLYKSVCFSTCPSGLFSNSITNTCDVSIIGNLVYFPCTITFLVWIFIVIYSRSQYSKTEGVTSAASGLALILWFAWLVLISTVATTDETLSSTSKSAVLGLGITGVLCSLIKIYGEDDRLVINFDQSKENKKGIDPFNVGIIDDISDDEEKI